MSVLAYQRFILQQEYPDSFVDFFEPFKKIILFDLMPIKAIVYLKVPIEISIERIKSRGREEPCTLEQINFLKDFKKYYENELIPEMISFGIKVIELDGTTSPEENARIIYEVTKGD